jgi:hexosaminidase
MRKIVLLVIAMLAASVFSQDIVPVPAKLTPGTGSFTLGSRSAVQVEGAVAPEVERLADRLRERLRGATGFSLRGERGDIVFALDSSLRAESYRLDVQPGGVRLYAADLAGFVYGTETLLQLFPADIYRRSRVERQWSIPAVSIEDAPRFGWRGAMMDVSRHFMPKEFVLKFLDLMAMHKLNTFHWHLTDDHGWRIEIKKYPLLTEVGSRMDFSMLNPEGATRSINQQAGGFYTQDDIREVVRFAADRGITVVPEIELPGHSNALIVAYPELGNKHQIEAAGGSTENLGYFQYVMNVDDSTIQFMKNVLDEVLELFPSKFIHIGGDEVGKEPWKRNPRAQERMRALGLKDEDELQSWFVRQFDDYLVSKGRRLIGWDEILEGGLAPNAAVMSWRGMGGGIAAAKAGHDVVMAPTSHTYLDYYQSRLRHKEPRAIGGFLPWQATYAFEPIPKELTPEQARHVLGGQAQLWAEYIPHPKHMEYMAFPRLAALSEVVWSPREARNLEDFEKRLRTHLQRLTILDVNYRPIDQEDEKPAGEWKSGQTSEEWAELTWDVPVTGAGTYQLTFNFIHGEHRLDISKVELLQGGQVVSMDEHEGRAGGEHRRNTYTLKVESYKPGATYQVRARVRSDGGNDSNGQLFFYKV